MFLGRETSFRDERKVRRRGGGRVHERDSCKTLWSVGGQRTKWPCTMQGRRRDFIRDTRNDELSSLDSIEFRTRTGEEKRENRSFRVAEKGRDRKVSKGETRNRTGEKEAWRSRGIRVGEKKGRGKKEFTNYKMQLSAFVRGVSRSIEAVPGFESGWRSFCTGCVIYRR